MPEPLYQFIDLAGLQAFKEESENQNAGAYASKMMITQNAETGVVTFKLFSSNNTLLDTKTLDLDTEHIIKAVSLDYANKLLIFTMNDDSTLNCDISDLIDGLSNDIDSVSRSLSDEVSRAEQAESLLNQNKLEKQIVTELPSQNVKTNTIYLLARNNEGVVTYRFESFNEDGTVKHADGLAEKTGVVDGDYTQIVVIKNIPVDQEAPDFVGQTFMILSNAGVDDNSLNELYTDDKQPTGIKIKIYTATVNGYYEYMYINNKWECIGGNGVDVSGKEDKSNKTNTFTGKTDDKHYPTTKLVKDNLDILAGDINAEETRAQGVEAKKLNYLEVNNIKALTNEQCESLRCGDIVAKVDGTGKHSYEVSFKKENVGLCLTYKDADYTETISYDYVNGNWTYNSQDSLEFASKADKVENGTENNIVLLDANGNIKDSGKGLNDVGKVDTVSVGGGTPIQPDANKNVDLPAYPTKTSLGLDNVDNTSDLSKPISTAQQTALDGKVNIIIVSSVTTLSTAQCEALNCGDIVVKNENGKKHSYIVSYKKENEMCLTYTDHENIEEVYYEKSSDVWAYVQTDNLAFNTLSLKTETGNKIDLEINSSNFKMVAKLYDKNNTLLSTSSEIDLPLESVVVSGSYDSATKEVVLTLQSGSVIRFSVADLVSGLQTEIDSTHKLSSDLVDDTGNTNKFVTAGEKAQITTNQQAIAGIKDGVSIDSFADVETALANMSSILEVADITALTPLQVNNLKAGDLVLENANNEKHTYSVSVKTSTNDLTLIYADDENVKEVYYSGYFYTKTNITKIKTEISTSTKKVWTNKSWVDDPQFSGSSVWTDGTNMYISNAYVLNRLTNTWESKSWNTNFNSAGIWSDGENIYSSWSQSNVSYTKQLVNGEWVDKTWNIDSLEPEVFEMFFEGVNVWSDGVDIYWTRGSLGEYKLIKATSTWQYVRETPINGSGVWSDGNDIYYSNGSTQKQLVSGEWVDKVWTGLTSFNGSNVWTDGTNIYCSDEQLSQKQLVNGAWVDKNWEGLSIKIYFTGNNVWKDGDNIYFSRGQYTAGNRHYQLIDQAVSIKGDLEDIKDLLESKKQDNLISGQNIKTINNQSILGEGNIDIQSGVNSVNGKTGSVVLDTDDISELNTGNKFLTSMQKNILLFLSNIPHLSGFRNRDFTGFIKTDEYSVPSGTGVSGKNIWTDGKNIYASENESQFIFDFDKNVWVTKQWSGLSNFYGQYIWSDGNDIYYSNGSTQKQLVNGAWIDKTWDYGSTGLTGFDGNKVWKFVFDGDTYIVYSDGTAYDSSGTTYMFGQIYNGIITYFAFDVIEFTGITNIDGSCIWYDNENIYYTQRGRANTYKLIADDYPLEWSPVQFTGPADMVYWNGWEMWTDGENIYHSSSNPSGNYILNKNSLTWNEIQFKSKTSGTTISFSGENVWSDGVNLRLDSSKLFETTDEIIDKKYIDNAISSAITTTLGGNY